MSFEFDFREAFTTGPAMPVRLVVTRTMFSKEVLLLGRMLPCLSLSITRSSGFPGLSARVSINVASSPQVSNDQLNKGCSPLASMHPSRLVPFWIEEFFPRSSVDETPSHPALRANVLDDLPTAPYEPVRHNSFFMLGSRLGNLSLKRGGY